jgi:hypothetical protein
MAGGKTEDYWKIVSPPEFSRIEIYVFKLDLNKNVTVNTLGPALEAARSTGWV